MNGSFLTKKKNQLIHVHPSHFMSRVGDGINWPNKFFHSLSPENLIFFPFSLVFLPTIGHILPLTTWNHHQSPNHQLPFPSLPLTMPSNHWMKMHLTTVLVRLAGKGVGRGTFRVSDLDRVGGEDGCEQQRGRQGCGGADQWSGVGRGERGWRLHNSIFPSAHRPLVSFPQYFGTPPHPITSPSSSHLFVKIGERFNFASLFFFSFKFSFHLRSLLFTVYALIKYKGLIYHMLLFMITYLNEFLLNW